MSLTKLTQNLNKVSGLPNKPSMDPEALKAVFDEAVGIIKDYINETLTTEIDSLVASKVDKVTGKVLSANDFTNALKTKLDGIATGATKNTVENVLTSTSTTNALSAAQGKSLKDSITSLDSAKQKKISIGTANPSGGSNGDIYIQYF